MGYRAFFSYARADDRIANWLHRQLDGYRTPKALIGSDGELGPVPPKLYPIFRDRTDLEAGGHVDSELQEALEDSDTLVVLCTPTSAKSHWVNHECETFLKLGREGRIFPVIAAGEPDSADMETECFPPALRGKGLLAADLREIRKPSGQLVGDGKDAGRLKLIAGLLGIPLDALVRRERVRQRRLVAGFAVASLVFAALAVLAAVAAGLAASRLDRSLRAESRERIERAAERLAAADPLSAMAMALSALPEAGERPLLADASAALQAAKAEDRLVLVRRRDDAIAQRVAFSRDDTMLKVLWNDGVLETLDRTTGLVRESANFLAPNCESQPVMLGMDDLGQTVLGLCPDLSERWPVGAVLVWNADHPAAPRISLAPPFEVARLLPTVDRYPVSFAGERALLYIMPGVPPLRVDFGSTPSIMALGGSDALQAELLPGGASAATVSIDENERGVACIWNASNGARVACAPASRNVLAIAPDPSGARIALVQREGVDWWNYESDTYEAALSGDQSDLLEHGLQYAGGALYGVTQQDRAVVVGRPVYRERATEISLQTSAETLDGLRLSHDGSYAAAMANASAVAVWRLPPRAGRAIALPASNAEIVAARVDDGRASFAWRTDEGVGLTPPDAHVPYAEVAADDIVYVNTPSGRKRIETHLRERFVAALRVAASARGEAPPAEDRLYAPQWRNPQVTQDGARVLVTAERSGVCEVWDAEAARIVYSSLQEAAAAWRSASASQGAIYWSCMLNAAGDRVARTGNVGVELRDLDADRRLWSDPRTLGLRFSADGSRLAAFSDSAGVLLIDARTGATLISNPTLPGLQMRAIAGARADQVVEIANGRMRLLRMADGVELARMNGFYYPRENGPWQSSDGRWFMTNTLGGLMLFDLQSNPIETQMAAARARAFPTLVFGRSTVLRADNTFIPRVRDASDAGCEAMLRDPLDPTRGKEAQIFPGADYVLQVASDRGCVHPPRPVNGGAAATYSWALSYLLSPSDHGPRDGAPLQLGASLVNAAEPEETFLSALENAGRSGRPIALLRAAQLRVSDSRATPDWEGAISLAREAARQRVPAAAWWLSEVLASRGEGAEARCWRALAADLGFPHAYARIAEAWERQILRDDGNPTRQRDDALRAIGLWTRTIEAARAAGWPTSYADYALGRRAMLARAAIVDEASVASAWRSSVEGEASRRRWTILGGRFRNCPQS